MMQLAKDLGKSLDELLEMSTVEFRLWAGFYNLNHKREQRTMSNGRHANNRKIR